jgi:hypothetical protein
VAAVVLEAVVLEVAVVPEDLEQIILHQIQALQQSQLKLIL